MSGSGRGLALALFVLLSSLFKILEGNEYKWPIFSLVVLVGLYWEYYIATLKAVKPDPSSEMPSHPE